MGAGPGMLSPRKARGQNFAADPTAPLKAHVASLRSLR